MQNSLIQYYFLPCPPTPLHPCTSAPLHPCTPAPMPLHPGFLFFTACFLTGWSIFSLLHSILRISPFPSRITIVSLAIQGLIVFLILIGMLIITLVPNTISQLTKSSPSALILLLGLLGVSALIGIIWVWF